MSISLSEIGLSLILIEGQRDNAIAEERRWRLREDAAREARIEAQKRVRRYSEILAEVSKRVCRYG